MNSFKFSSRIVEIIEKIEKKNSIIVDVGCDHCYTSIKALVEKKAKFAYNIDVNEKPLLSGIKNIKKFNLEKKTKNIIANGLDTNEIKKTVNYCIISGMGGKTICEIIQNKNKKIKIKNYILVPNNNEYQLRLLLKKNG
jgi:tRNA (adenine22-N1)-methyltransferase